jgi:hypothetical protein
MIFRKQKRTVFISVPSSPPRGLHRLIAFSLIAFSKASFTSVRLGS